MNIKINTEAQRYKVFFSFVPLCLCVSVLILYIEGASYLRRSQRYELASGKQSKFLSIIQVAAPPSSQKEELNFVIIGAETMAI